MFCTVKQNKNKYVVYLSERVREGGKVKSKDKYLFSLESQEIENKAYIEWSQYTALSDEEKELVFNKLNNISIPLHTTTRNEPLQATTQEKSLHITTRIDIIGQVEEQVLEYHFFINDIFIDKFDSLDFTHCRISVISKQFRDECQAKGFDPSNEELDKLYDDMLDIWNYHRKLKEKQDADMVEYGNKIAEHFQALIAALQLKIAELENNCSGSKRNATTTDPTRVKKIYRALASRLHPDNGGSDELMQMLNELKDMIN